MAATARVIWLCACERYWPYQGVGTYASVLSLGCKMRKPVYRVLQGSRCVSDVQLQIGSERITMDQRAQ